MTRARTAWIEHTHVLVLATHDVLCLPCFHEAGRPALRCNIHDDAVVKMISGASKANHSASNRSFMAASITLLLEERLG